MTAHPRPELVDELMEFYVDWREQCANVRASYERFTLAQTADRALAFAAYQAALDREESASNAYAERIRRIGDTASQTIAPDRTTADNRFRRPVTPGRADTLRPSQEKNR